MSSKGWIGVDFDGTLAEYHGWAGEFTFGEPIAPMVQRVKDWLANGYEVKVVTARVSEAAHPEVAEALQKWMDIHLGVVLPLTCMKDFAMIELWDDRAVQVVQNTGEPVPGQLSRTEGPPIVKDRYCLRCRTLEAQERSSYCSYCLQLSGEDFAKPFSQEEADTLRW